MLSSQNLFIVLYNLLFLTLFLLWLYRDQLKPEQFVMKTRTLHLWFLSISFLIVSFLLNVFVLVTDVDDAIISGTTAFIKGSNPYVENVVVHLLNGNVVFGVYHYFPSDLLVYSSMSLIISPITGSFPLLTDSWFVIANLSFLTLSYLVVRLIVIPKDDQRLLTAYILVTSAFLFTNSSLMILYFVLGFYFFKKNKFYLGVVFYILAAGAKYMTGLFLLVQFIEELSHVNSKEDLNLFKPYILGGLLFFLIIIPFGPFNVLNATFLYQGDIMSRTQVAGIYGPVLVELALGLNILQYFNIMFLFAALGSVGVAFKFGKSTYERQMILSFLFMFILPFYGTELFAVSLLLWYFEVFGHELNFPAYSSHFSNHDV